MDTYAGTTLPETKWNKDGKLLTVTIGDQVDGFTFTKGNDGRTHAAEPVRIQTRLRLAATR
jgi:hypothetical protein